jgi:hypothetical protein
LSQLSGSQPELSEERMKQQSKHHFALGRPFSAMVVIGALLITCEVPVVAQQTGGGITGPP